MFIPRIGQEVLVEFLEGDPDQPIVTGRVYNGDNMPPYALPSEKTKSTLKSNSSIGGGGSNEIRFEDGKDKEEIYLHGQKDWTIAVENVSSYLTYRESEMTEREFHDAVMTSGNMPIEMVRARLAGLRVTRDFVAQWKFYEPPR